MSQNLTNEQRQELAQKLFKEGDALDDAGNQAEAIKKFEEAIALKPDYAKAYFGKAFSLCTLGRLEEGIVFYSKAIEHDPKWAMAHFNKGTNLYDLGKKEEAMICYENAILYNPKHFDAHNNKGNTLFDFGKYEEAIQSYDVVIEGKPEYPYVYQGKGNALYALGRKEEALECFDKALSLNSTHPLFMCNRAKCLYSLGKTKEAVKDLNKVQELMKTSYSNVLSRINYNYINVILSPLIELHKVADKVESAMKGADESDNTDNNTMKKIIEQIGQLQKEKDRATTAILDNLEKKSTDTSKKPTEEIDRLKEEFQKQLPIVNQEMAHWKFEAKKIEQFENLRAEFNSRIEEFSKKLDAELEKQGAQSENLEKARDYFRGFTSTFNSVYVISQLAESGDLQVNTDNTKATVLSTMASLAPFLGHLLTAGIKSLGEFVQSKEMKVNARKMKGLAGDTKELSQLVGKTGYEIILNSRKQQQIVEITSEDLKKASGGLFEKISRFCESLDEEVDAFLYGRMYKTHAAQLGHNDANELIQEWISGKIEMFEVKERFVKIAVDMDRKEAALRPEMIPSDASGRSRCCSMF